MFLSFLKRVFFATKDFSKRTFSAFLYRAKPRLSFQWVLSVILWLVIICYISFGIFLGVAVYHKHSESRVVKFSVKFYPLPAAIVNSNVVWGKDYYQQLAYIRQFSEKTKQAVPDPAVLRGQIIDQLIENGLLETQAAKNHISVTSKDVDAAYQKIVDQSGGDAEVKKVLADLYGMNVNDFKGLIRQQVLRQKIQDELMMQVKVAHVLIKDETQANDVAARTKKDEDFAALAKQYSEDTKSNTAGGELGWLARGQFVISNVAVPEFDNAVFAAKKGDIVGPVKTSAGFEIIKIEDKKGKINQEFNSWLTNLKKTAKIWRLIK